MGTKRSKRSVMPQGGLLSNLLMKMMAGILEQHRGSRRLLGGEPSIGRTMMKPW